jgi:hypothetical protein
MKQLKCENCDATTGIPGAVGWFQLDQHPDGVDTTRFDQPHGPFDLCSLDCVAGFAAKIIAAALKAIKR